jgi:hypothetical protein
MVFHHRTHHKNQTREKKAKQSKTNESTPIEKKSEKQTKQP